MRTAIMLVLVALLSSSASAGPLRETLKWTALESAGQLGADHFSSWYFDNKTHACVENNPMLARDDRSYSMAKGWTFNLIGIGGLSASLYIAKRTHKPRLERLAKAAMSFGAGSGAYFGVYNWMRCR